MYNFGLNRELHLAVVLKNIYISPHNLHFSTYNHSQIKFMIQLLPKQSEFGLRAKTLGV